VGRLQQLPCVPCQSTKQRARQQGTLDAGFREAVREVLQSAAIVKAGVGIHGDAEKLQLDHSCVLTSALDIGAELNRRTQPAGCDLVEHTAFTLAEAAERLLRRTLAKPQALRCSNWEQRPLSGEQRRYAALDALASLRCAQAALCLPLRLPLRACAPLPPEQPSSAGAAQLPRAA
jgi:3'-5' exonuclease